MASPMHKMSYVKNSNDQSWLIMKHDWSNMGCQEHVWDVMLKILMISHDQSWNMIDAIWDAKNMCEI